MGQQYDRGIAFRTASWHQHVNERVLSEYPASVAEARPIAFERRDGEAGWWEPKTVEVYVKDYAINEDGELVETFVPIDGKQAIVRDNAPSVVLGLASED